MYVEGDILLAGLFGVRAPGSPDLMCGPVTNEGFQIAESVVHAINVVNNKKMLLKTKTQTLKSRKTSMVS